MRNVVSNRTIAKAIYKGDMMLSVFRNMEKTGQPWDWNKPNADESERLWDTALNQSLNPDDWDWDWRRYTDFNTENGIARLRAWVGFNNTTHGATETGWSNNKYAITMYGEDWVSADWFRNRTAITQVAYEATSVERRYVNDTMTDWFDVLIHDGVTYVNAKDAMEVIRIVNNDVHEVTPFTDWVRANARWYSQQYQPKETDGEEEW